MRYGNEYTVRTRRKYSYVAGWHADVTAAVNPPSASILRAEVVPEVGGDTTWTNLVAAYASLSAPVRAFVDGLTVPVYGLLQPDCLWFHVVTVGRLLLEVDGAEPRVLQAGDLALVPHGQGHTLRSAPGTLCPDVLTIDQEYSDSYSVLRYGGGGAPTTLVCGAVRLEQPARTDDRDRARPPRPRRASARRAVRGRGRRHGQPPQQAAGGQSGIVSPHGAVSSERQ